MMELDESKRLDINYQEVHGDLYPLMKNAGKSVYETVKDFYGGGRNILFICGPGNNGGDGIVAAVMLGTENRVRIILLTGGADRKLGDLAERAISEIKNASIIKNPPKNVIQDQVNWSEIIVDSMFGTGIGRNIEGIFASATEIMNKSGKPIVSVDIPSGIGTNLQVKPKMTVTFTDSKEGMTAENCGEIVIKDIGIEKELIHNAGAGEMAFFPDVKPHAHKGENGILLMLAGWEYHGSGVIASRAAMSALPDLVHVLVPKSMYTIFASNLHEQVVHTYSEDRVKQIMERATGAVVGPGMGMGADAREAIATIASSGINTVMDAEATRMAGEGTVDIRNGMVFTPHATEFKLLTGLDPSKENAEKFAQDNNCVILLKGETDYITTGTRTIMVGGGSPRMAMGGTGDLLAGLTGGFISRGMTPFRSAVLASFLNKRNGEAMEKYASHWFGVDDMLGNLNTVIRRYHSFAHGKGMQ